jgi:hypothetical protein
MAIALVGSEGTVATGTTSAAPTFAQPTTAGNLLVLWVMSADGIDGGWTGLSSWTLAKAQTGNSGSQRGTAGIFYIANCGTGVSAPTPTAANASFTAAKLNEYSGAATTLVLEKTSAYLGGTSSPQTVATTAADAASGDLVTTILSFFGTAGTMTISDVLNNGATTNNVNDAATSNGNHYDFSWGVTTSNGSADQTVCTFTHTGSVLEIDAVAISFIATGPPPPQQSHQSATVVSVGSGRGA